MTFTSKKTLEGNQVNHWVDLCWKYKQHCNKVILAQQMVSLGRLETTSGNLGFGRHFRQSGKGGDES